MGALTSGGVLSLNTGTDLYEMVPSHLVDQEFRCASIGICNTLGKIIQNSLLRLLNQMRFLFIGGNLHLNMSRMIRRSVDEHRSVTKHRLGLENETVNSSADTLRRSTKCKVNK